MFDAVLFDCDGVLIDTEMLALDLEVDFLAANNFHYDRMDFARAFIGMDGIAMRAQMARDYEAQHARSIPPTLFDDMWAARDAHFKTHLTSIADAEKSLTAWTGKKAVASSSKIEHLKTNLTQVGLAHLVYPHVYSADQVERGKPHPDVFLFAAEKLAANPQKCLVIEDSINGVKAGCAAGMTVWGFLGGGHVWPELTDQLQSAGAHDIVSSHAQLAEKLKKASPEKTKV
ncbi:HAD family hydrolase [Hirschia baltica]|uniref:HAD-superfamily hydrolase, subfamily IA, variant 3 n=1 Tax=Hirschia baltica (strain ATCC 49814 / DSM 5838 / IFAM 1418) TaxID=582402 RepID=C6XMU7_HIRBI|nr:HAD family phosphatase [Hirschia baltica]ACT60011.1 HAD-superfamily hydrolase, subfamily IA, variant 3 [Hirschia baltica ATCC 49814]